MITIQFPTDKLEDITRDIQLLNQLKGHHVSCIQDWKIPCGSGMTLTLRIEGPVGMIVQEHHFDQAIQLLTVAKTGVRNWSQDSPRQTDAQDDGAARSTDGAAS